MQVTNYFDDWAARYDRDLMSFGYAVPERIAGGIEGVRVLDIGIGTGLCTAALKARLPQCEVSGVDASAKMVAECRAKGLCADLRVQDVASTPLPYADAAFDGVMLGGVSEFMQDPEFMLAEAARVLRRGGTLAIAFEGLEGARLYTWVRHTEHYARVLRFRVWPYPRVYRKYLHDAGFIKGVLQRVGLHINRAELFAAYRRPNGQNVPHWLIVAHKI